MNRSRQYTLSLVAESMIEQTKSRKLIELCHWNFYIRNIFYILFPQ